MEDFLGEFYLENLGGPEKGGRFLTGPESSDPDDKELSLQKMGYGGRNQLWRFENGILQCVGNQKVIDIYSYYSGEEEEGAPVLAWHERHGGKNQKLYFLRMTKDEEDWVLIGRSSDLADDYYDSTIFLNFAMEDDIPKPRMKAASLADHCPEQRWKITYKDQPYWWEPMSQDVYRPENALIAGRDETDDVYISMYEIKGEKILGKMHSNVCYIAYDGREKKIEEGKWKVLCVNPKAKVKWHLVHDGRLPENTLKASVVSDEVEYIGRGPVGKNQITPGRIIPERNWCIASWGEVPHFLRTYQALVITM